MKRNASGHDQQGDIRGAFYKFSEGARFSDLFTDIGVPTGLYWVIIAIMLIKAVHKLTKFGQADEVFNLGPPLHGQRDG